MDIPKIYLETSIFSFYHETREHGEYVKYKTQVHDVFDRIKNGHFEAYTSIFVLDEISKERNEEKLLKMQSLLNEYSLTFLEISEEVDRLADLYINEGAISPTWKTDAILIAMATVYDLDFIMSLNFTHIVRAWTIERVRRVNNREGYHGIGIYRPVEVLEL